MQKARLVYELEVDRNISADDVAVINMAMEVTFGQLKQAKLIKGYPGPFEAGLVTGPQKTTKAPREPRHRYADSIVLSKENYETLVGGAAQATIHKPIRLSKTLSRVMSLEEFQKCEVRRGTGLDATAQIQRNGVWLQEELHAPVMSTLEVYCKEYWRPVITSRDDYVEYYWGGTRVVPAIKDLLRDGDKAKLDYEGADPRESSDKWHSPSSMPVWAARYAVRVLAVNVEKRSGIWQWEITVGDFRKFGDHE